MDTLSTIPCFSRSPKFPSPNLSPKPLFKRTQPSTFPVLRAATHPVNEVVEDDVLRIFLREREMNGDFISKVCVKFWKREVEKLVDVKDDKVSTFSQEVEQVMESDSDGGFLKLSITQEWVLGDNPAPVNKKAIAKELQDDRERRKRLNLLEYEALKRELAFLSVGIGAACSGYCLVVFSVQAAVSYAIGVLFSCLYLQLLCQHADILSKEMVPQIFMKKKTKKIGIRSEDLRDSFERLIKGSSIALSSPRLVIPAAIYGLWVLSHRYFSNDIFDFQLVPAMFGMFVYKAAALVQVYRDNDDLKLVFPDNGEGISD